MGGVGRGVGEGRGRRGGGRRWRAVMAAGDGDVKLGTLGSGSESSSDGSSESPSGAGAATEGGGWAAAVLALLTGGGEMLLNVALVALVLLGAYRLWVRWGRRGLGAGAGAGEESPAASLPRMKKRDFSLEQLRQYDGSRTPRILLAVNGKVFDVTKGSKFYGPGEEELEGEGEDLLQLRCDPLLMGRPLGTGLVSEPSRRLDPCALAAAPGTARPTHTPSRGHLQLFPPEVRVSVSPQEPALSFHLSTIPFLHEAFSCAEFFKILSVVARRAGPQPSLSFLIPGMGGGRRDGRYLK